MAFSLVTSDSDSDLEGLGQLSDWDNSASDSDSDDIDLHDDGFRGRRASRKIRRINYMQSLDDAEFTFRFRLSKPAVNQLLNEIIPFIRVTSSRNHGVSPIHQLLLTLRFYALGTMLISIADFVDVSKSTAGRIVRDISICIARLYDKYIHVQQGGAEKFHRIAGFPRVLGTIDCTHIRIQSPCRLVGEEFRNRKGYFSYNIQAVCDADLRLMNVVARWPGSAHDATIFNNSVLRAQCDAGQFGNHWLLGDSAYPNRPYLLTPVLNPVTEAELRYNQAHIKTRNTIERTFGVWKRRFPVLALTLRLSQPVMQSVIIATAVLHNICRNHSLEEVPPEVEILGGDNNVEDGSQNMDMQDISGRTDLINNFFNSEEN
ncbi:putative nuclease HARBI1 [Bombyx mori]|uniref:DDE Tnp4 domain-containing protein n=1 Tax=Bombyx mori TaxID=7091 RepID=A0A8R2G8C9_BOMMO|nr:putative nuclease HARBI1 [Bombyx mori]